MATASRAKRIDDDWGLPDPQGLPPGRVREIRDEVKVNGGVLPPSAGGRCCAEDGATPYHPPARLASAHG